MSDIKWFWLRDSRKNPLACVATRVGEQGLAYAIAIPNPKDKFAKDRGRNIAIGRLEHGKPKMITLQDGVPPKQQVYGQIAEDRSLPERIRTAAFMSLATAKLNARLNTLGAGVGHQPAA